jgi:hypothetical protein
VGVVSLCIMADESRMQRLGGQEVCGVSESVLRLPGLSAGSLACTQSHVTSSSEATFTELAHLPSE